MSFVSSDDCTNRSLELVRQGRVDAGAVSERAGPGVAWQN